MRIWQTRERMVWTRCRAVLLAGVFLLSSFLPGLPASGRAQTAPPDQLDQLDRIDSGDPAEVTVRK